METNIENVLTQDFVESLLQNVVHKEGILDPVFVVNDGYKKGDGYTSFWTMVTIRGTNKELNLAIKCAPKNKEFREMMPVNDSYAREIYFYETVAPAFKQIQTEANVGWFTALPICYKTMSEENEELLVLENIRSSGFRLWNCRIPMDDSHIFLALKEFAKFHATSLALKDQNRGLYEGIVGGMKEIFARSMVEKFLELVKTGADRIIALMCQDEGICEAIKRFKESLGGFFDMLEEKAGVCEIIIHGDCWCNNMMFKYEDSTAPNKPTTLNLIDFQLSGVSNPVIDIAALIYLSCGQNVLDDLERYVGYYHEQLSGFVKDLGSDPDHIYSKQAFLNDWKVYSKFGLIMGCTEFQVMLREDDELIGIDGLDQNTFRVMMTESIVNQSEADTRLCNLAKHMYANGFI